MAKKRNTMKKANRYAEKRKLVPRDRYGQFAGGFQRSADRINGRSVWVFGDAK